MIVNIDNTKDAVIKGDIQSNQVDIDKDNINSILTLLTTNLYSNSIGSLVRENVSNAWDSHKEANTGKPVLVNLYKDGEGRFIFKIEDFGVGLSEERFNKIYKNIGSSTKRATNDYIGGFGVGRFSSLSYTDMVYITSNYNNVEYNYVMYKDNDNISIDLLNKIENVEKKSGVIIKIIIKDVEDVIIFRKAILEQLLFFNNVFIKDSIDITNADTDRIGYSNTYLYNNISFKYETAEIYNKVTIKEFEDFCVAFVKDSFIPTTIHILLGQVTYPIPKDVINGIDDSIPFKHDVPIVLKFDIGELKVTPNREQIIFTKNAVEKIKEKYKKVFKKLKEIHEKQNTIDITKPSEYYDKISNKPKINLFENSNIDDPVLFDLSVFNEKNKKIFKNNCTYNKKNFKLKNLDIVNNAFSHKNIIHTPLYYIYKDVKNKSDVDILYSFDFNKAISKDIKNTIFFYVNENNRHIANKKIIVDYLKYLYKKKNKLIVVSSIKEKLFIKDYKNVIKSINEHKKEISNALEKTKENSNLLTKNDKNSNKETLDEIRFYIDFLKEFKTDNFKILDESIIDVNWRNNYKKENKTLKHNSNNKRSNLNIQHISLDLYKSYFKGKNIKKIVKRYDDVKEIEKTSNILIYATPEKEKVLVKLFRLMEAYKTNKNFDFGIISKTKAKWLKPFKNCISVEKIMKNPSLIKNLATKIFLKKYFNNLYKIDDKYIKYYCKENTAKDLIIVKELMSCSHGVSYLSEEFTNEFYDYALKHNLIDDDILNIIVKHKTTINILINLYREIQTVNLILIESNQKKYFLTDYFSLKKGFDLNEKAKKELEEAKKKNII